MMKKTIGIVLAALVLASLACKLVTGSNEGNVLYMAVDENGQPRTQELVLSDLNGKEVRRIQLPDIPMLLYPTRASQTALVETVNNEWYLVKTDSGTVDRLAFGADGGGNILPDLAGFQSVPSARWLVMGKASGAPIFLVDLDSGDLEELTAIKGVDQLYYGMFSTDGKYLVAYGDRAWLIPTDDPDSARKVGGNTPTFSVNFSKDGKRLVYVQRLEDGSYQVKTANLDGSETKEAFSREDAIIAAVFAPDDDHLLILGRNTAMLYNMDTQTLYSALDLPEDSAFNRLWLSGDHRKALIGYNDGDRDYWVMLDLQDDRKTALDDLTDIYLIYLTGASSTYRWLVFVDDLTIGQPAHFTSLDIKTNEAHAIGGMDRTAGFVGMRDVSGDGKYTLVTTQKDEAMQLWILDAEKGEARLLGEGRAVGGSLSANAQWVVVAEYDRENKSIRVVATQGDEEKALGEGYGPVWVRP